MVWVPGTALEQLKVFSREEGGSLSDEPQLKQIFLKTSIGFPGRKANKPRVSSLLGLSEGTSWGMRGWTAGLEVL